MTQNAQHISRRILLPVIAGFALRVFLICYLGNYRAPTAWEYGEIARNLVAGNGYLYMAYRSWIPPLYPLLLAGAMEVFGDRAFLALEVFQAGLSAVTALLLYLLGSRLFGRPVGFIVLALMLIYPPLAVKTAYVDPITVEVFLLVLAFVFLYRSIDNPSVLNRGLTGGLLGLATLSRSVLLIFAVVLSCCWLLLRVKQRRDWGVVLAAFGLCLLPWGLRNYAVHREFILISSNGGFNFWIGNNPLSTGDAYAVDSVPIWEKMPPELRARLAGLSEAEQDRALYREGVRFILREPATFLRLVLKRIEYFWWFRPQAGRGDLPVPAVWSLGYYVLYGLLLAAGTAGMVTSRHRWRDLFPFYALFLSLSLVYAVFFIHTRYRMILEPFLMIFAGLWLLSFATRLKHKFSGGFNPIALSSQV